MRLVRRAAPRRPPDVRRAAAAAYRPRLASARASLRASVLGSAVGVSAGAPLAAWSVLGAVAPPHPAATSSATIRRRATWRGIDGTLRLRLPVITDRSIRVCL